MKIKELLRSSNSISLEFYPSISRELLLKSLNHARENTDITDEEIEIIVAFKKSIQADNRRTWLKSCVDNFDVPMGAYDSAQIADLIGIYVLDTFGCIVNLEQMGLYWDDRIIFITGSNGPKTSKIHKKIIRAFKLLGLRNEMGSNLKIVNFLDVTLNLDKGTFKPFSKSYLTPSNIIVNSNHPRSIQKQIPNAVTQRINKLSSCEKKLRTKGYMMKPSKIVDSKVDWST